MTNRYRNLSRAAGRALTVHVLLMGLLTLVPARAGAQEAPDGRKTELGALVDIYYDYNFNKPAGDAPLRNFDTKHNQFAFSMAEVWLASVPTADHRAGFNVKLNFGPSSAMIHANEPGTSAIFENLQQGYISYLLPVGHALQIDAGKFVTQHGAEVIEAKDNWNYSRSLLFALAIPYYHMGVRATYALNDQVTIMGTVVNGWNNVVDNNSRRTYGAMITLKPVPQLAIVQNYMGGPEQTGNDTDWRHLSDTTVTYTASPVLSLTANYDYGRDTVAGVSTHWTGLAAYAKYQANTWVALSPRVEWYDDPQGFTTGAPQTLKELTLTSEFKAADNLVWRVEYRSDFSSVPFYRTHTGSSASHQATLAFGLLYSFGATL